MKKLIVILGLLGIGIYLGAQNCFDESFETVCERIGGEVEESACISKTETTVYNTNLATELLERLSIECKK